MPTVPFHWEPVGGGVLNMDDGRGEDLPREAEGYSPANILWDIADGGDAAGTLADPERAGERTWLVGVSTSSERLQVLLIAD